MRKLYFKVLIAGLAVMGFSTAASAISVDLIWSAATGGVGTTISGNSVTIQPSGVQTLTLDIKMSGVTSLSAYFLNFEFDTDFKNELDFLSGTQPVFHFVGGSVFIPVGPSGFEAANFTESTAGLKGQLAHLDGSGAAYVGAAVTFTVGDLVFVTNHGNVSNDGNDVFSAVPLSKIGQALVILDGANVNITSAVTFNSFLKSVSNSKLRK